MTTTSPDPATAVGRCPACGADLTSDPRFTRWCRGCSWNAHPGASAAKKRGDRFQRRLNRAAEERLYHRIRQEGTAPRSIGAAGIAAFALAGVVHLVTAGMILLGVLWLLSPSWPLRLLGGVLPAAAYLLRPRLGPNRAERRRRRLVDRRDAPALYGLCARVAAELGTAPPEAIAVDGSYNAGYGLAGIRGGGVLTLGLPLWETLAPAERLALLGHELGHRVGGDIRRRLWVGSALGTLEEWYRLFRPDSATRQHVNGVVAAAEMVAAVLMGVFAELALLARRVLSRLTALSGRRAEYLADELAARVAGPQAAAALLAALTLDGALTHVRQQHRPAVRRSTGGQDGADFWADLRAYTESIPDSERARRLLVSQLDDSAVDSAHPPTHLRLDFVRQLPPAAPAIVLDSAEAAAVDEELAPLRTAVARDLLS